MKWADDTDARRYSLFDPPATRREDQERAAQLANHLAMLDDSETTTAHRRRALDILKQSRPLPGGIIAIPRDWCIVHFTTDPETGREQITPVLFMSARQYDAFLATWYPQEAE
jgi:hypothetical protein